MIRQREVYLVVVALQWALTAGAGQPKDLFSPRIKVPKAFGERVCESWVSSANRYRGAFQRGWQACLADRIAGRPCRDLASSGWPSEAQGYADGYLAADDKFNELGKSINTAKAQEAAILYLSHVREAKERRAGKPEPKDACEGRDDGKQ